MTAIGGKTMFVAAIGVLVVICTMNTSVTHFASAVGLRGEDKKDKSQSLTAEEAKAKFDKKKTKFDAASEEKKGEMKNSFVKKLKNGKYDNASKADKDEMMKKFNDWEKNQEPKKSSDASSKGVEGKKANEDKKLEDKK